VPRLLRQVPELLATSMARLQALDPDLVRGELGRAGEVPVASPAYDVGYTSLLLSEPPLKVPAWQRPLVRRFGQVLAGRFAGGYRRRAAAAFEPGELTWHQAVACLRALVEVAGWDHQGVAATHAGHPWLVSGPAFARRLAALTRTPVRAR
jgi:hypothetical protein